MIPNKRWFSQVYQFLAIAAFVLLPIALPVLANATRRFVPTPHPEIGSIAAIGVLTMLVFLLDGLLGDRWRTLPCSALVIVMLPYAIFGWLLSVYNLPWSAWISAEVVTGFVTAAVSFELGMAATWILLLSAVLTVVGAIASKIVGISARALAMALGLTGAWLFAVGGAKFRMAALNFDEFETFWVLVFISLAGLWLGWAIDTFLYPPLGIGFLKWLAS